jgi:hypothetical protein
MVAMTATGSKTAGGEDGTIKEAVPEHHSGVHHHKTPAQIYREHFHGGRRERMFLASFSFFVAFFIVRAITLSIHEGIGPFHDITPQGFHLHHMFWGILTLLLVGYLWLMQLGTGAEGCSLWCSRLTALLFGIGAALTLDEFALWLRFQDVYWTREGRESIDAVILFGALLSVGLWGRPFFHGITLEIIKHLRGHPDATPR